MGTCLKAMQCHSVVLSMPLTVWTSTSFKKSGYLHWKTSISSKSSVFLGNFLAWLTVMQSKIWCPVLNVDFSGQPLVFVLPLFSFLIAWGAHLVVAPHLCCVKSIVIKNPCITCVSGGFPSCWFWLCLMGVTSPPNTALCIACLISGTGNGSRTVWGKIKSNLFIHEATLCFVPCLSYFLPPNCWAELLKMTPWQARWKWVKKPEGRVQVK